MNLNKPKANLKLKKLSWEELDWLEQKCRALKEKADGPRVYSSSGDATHRNQASRSLAQHFEDVFEKHHPGCPMYGDEDDNY